MGYELQLPKDTQQCEDVVARAVSRAEEHRQNRQVSWWLVHHYLGGCRSFSNVNFMTGTLDVNMDPDGMLRFKYEDVVAKYQARIGRLLQVDLNPAVSRKNIGLEDTKQAALAQIALRHAFPPSEVRRLHEEVLPPFTKYGCVGLAVWSDSGEVGLDVVMPWEIISVPPAPLETAEVRALGRVRWVPEYWVKGLPGVPGPGAGVWGQMEGVNVDAAAAPGATTGRFTTFGSSATYTAETMGFKQKPTPMPSAMGGSKGKGGDKTTIKMVKFVELWTKDRQGYVGEYLRFAGGRLLSRESFTDLKQPIPLVVATDMPTSGLYGRGYVETLIPMNTEVEYALGSWFQAIHDWNVYGILCTPTNLQIPTEVLRAADGTKRIPFTPDLSDPNSRPFAIEPVNAGEAPAKAVAAATALADRIANQPTELMSGSAPGRVDSERGIGLLYELSNMPLSPTVTSLARAFQGAYAAVLAILPSVWSTEKMLMVSVLDDAMAGIVMDPSSGTVTLNSGLNALPRPDMVDIGVKSMNPRSKEAEKRDLYDALTAGMLTKLEFALEVRKRGLEMPVGFEVEWQNYRRAKHNNIVLFGDGQRPARGQVRVEDADLHEVHLMAIAEFMARPEFFAASDEVQQAFTDLVLERRGRLARYPPQLPYPEELEKGPEPVA